MSEPTAPAQEATPTPVQATDGDSTARLAIVERELKEARSEAAKHRTALRSYEQAQADAEAKRLKEQGDFKALYEAEQARAADLATAVARHEVMQRQQSVAIELGLPLELADRLRGDTPAEIKADAQKLLALLTPPPQAGAAPTSPVPATAPTNPATTRQTKAPFDPKNPPRLGSVDWTKT